MSECNALEGRDLEYPRAGVTGVVSTWRGWWALNLNLLEEQKVPITSESPFWPLYLRVSINFPLYLWTFTILTGL